MQRGTYGHVHLQFDEFPYPYIRTLSSHRRLVLSVCNTMNVEITAPHRAALGQLPTILPEGVQSWCTASGAHSSPLSVAKPEVLAHLSLLHACGSRIK